MKKKITLLAAAAMLFCSGYKAQTGCSDLNGFVNSKNVGPTGSVILKLGNEEYAAQTYHYSGPGKITGARIYGNYPGISAGVPLRIGVANVDASGRPTTMITSVNDTWWWFDNATGYINVTFGGGGVTVNNSFAITVEVRNASPFGNTFNLQYTGNGEGLHQDLASLAGTSTGFNWTSAMSSFSRDGDFYLVPRMMNFITPGFQVSSQCVATSAPVNFSNTTQMTTDSMFNRIGWSGYTGTNKYYQWNFGDGSPVSNLLNPVHSYTLPGVYTVTLTATIDGWGGVCTNSYTKKISVGLAVSTPTINDATCYGTNSGQVIAAPFGGASPYSYSLNDITYQSSAVFNNLFSGAHVMYIKDNLGCKSSIAFNVNQPVPIVFTSTASTNANCGTSTGAILVTATGGTGTIQYQLNTNPFQSTGSFTNLAIGVYAVTAKDANGCTAITPVIVNDFGGPVLTTNYTNVSCANGSDGSITLNSTGGTGTIQYSINNGFTYQTSGVFSNLLAGTYSVIVKDAAGCTDVATIVVKQAQLMQVTASTSSVLCNGGSTGQINVTSSSGGIGAHNYSIDGINYQSGFTFAGLSAGTYTVYAKDAAGCLGTTTVMVTQPAAIVATVSTFSALCNGDYNGSIVVGASGGTGSFIYSVNGTDFQHPNTFSELSAGTYTIIVKDGNNCTYSTSATINQPSAVTATVNTTNSTCGNTNGGILAIASGGSGSGYQYSINNITFNSTGSFSPLAAGTYYVIVRDGTGCQTVVRTTIADSNGPVINNQSFTNVSCNGGNDGSLTITNVTGGTGTLQYSINGITWQTSPVFSGLLAGVYNVTVKDANSCTGNVAITISQPNAFVITSAVSNVSCNGAGTGSAAINASGGSGILAYSNNGGLTYQSSNMFTNLTAGTYSIIVKDAANCHGYYSFSITQPSAINLNLGVLNVSCSGANNGGVHMTASGGTGSLLYSLDGITWTTNTSFLGLSGNTVYTALVRDANNCVKTATFFVSQPSLLNVSASVNNVNCAGGNNGAVNLNVSGGIQPYTYQWSNGSTSQNIFNVTAGVYSVTVTDVNGCSSVKTYTVTQPSNPIIINGVITPATGSSSGNGAINLTVTGGVAPYTYVWSNSATTQNISGLNPGAYLVTITDANGCTSSTTYIVGNATGIANVTVNNGDILVYPNPADHFATVEAKGYKIDKVELINIIGQRVMVDEPKDSKAELDISNIEAGTYFVKVYVNSTVVTKKINIAK